MGFSLKDLKNMHTEALVSTIKKMSDDQVLELLRETKDDEGTLFHLAVKNEDPSVLETLISKIPQGIDSELPSLLQAKEYGWNVFHMAAEHKNPSVLQALIKMVPSETALVHLLEERTSDLRPSLLQRFQLRITSGLTAFDIINKSSEKSTVPEDTLKLLTNKITDKDNLLKLLKMSMLKNEGWKGIHMFACYKDSGFQTLLKNLPYSSDLAKLLQARTNNGESVFHFAACNENSDAFQALIAKVPDRDLLGLLQARTNNGANVFHIAASNENSGAFQALIAKVPDRDLLGLLEVTVRTRNCEKMGTHQQDNKLNVLQCAAKYQDSVAFQALLERIPDAALSGLPVSMALNDWASQNIKTYFSFMLEKGGRPLANTTSPAYRFCLAHKTALCDYFISKGSKEELTQALEKDSSLYRFFNTERNLSGKLGNLFLLGQKESYSIIKLKEAVAPEPNVGPQNNDSYCANL